MDALTTKLREDKEIMGCINCRVITLERFKKEILMDFIHRKYIKMNKEKQFIITKKIAKHGNQNIIVIPTILSEKIKPQMLVKVTIDILDENLEDKE